MPTEGSGEAFVAKVLCGAASTKFFRRSGGGEINALHVRYAIKGLSANRNLRYDSKVNLSDQ
jgi:hypothetical protein